MKKKGLVHAIAICRNCKWEASWYLTAVRKAREHVRKTGHTVDVETGYAQTLTPKEDD